LQIPLAYSFAIWQGAKQAAEHGATRGDTAVSINVSFHSDEQTKFKTDIISLGFRLVRSTNKSGNFDLYLLDRQARELAEAILASLAETEAKKSEAA
tara:strand:- start:233 stop:523 length:291 start_codon:yes stop_codon:yes gene_type:complete